MTSSSGQSRSGVIKVRTDDIQKDEVELPQEAKDPAYREAVRQLLLNKHGRPPTSKEIDEAFSKMVIKRKTINPTDEDIAIAEREFGINQ